MRCVGHPLGSAKYCRYYVEYAQKTGLSKLQAGVQTRYEINKKIMPFIDIAYAYHKGADKTPGYPISPDIVIIASLTALLVASPAAQLFLEPAFGACLYVLKL